MPLPILPRARTALWTLEKISALSTPEVRQLHANAQRLEEEEIAALCTQVLTGRPRGIVGPRAAPVRKKPRTDGRVLTSRSQAFGMRGAILANRFWSRSGLTAAGEVVFALWNEDVKHASDGSSYLLWAPNEIGRAHV
jgi:hypothetical protein